MPIRELYPNAKDPTPPRFNVGDVVYTNGTANLPGFVFDVNSTISINETMERYEYTENRVIIQPAVFGVIVDEPDYGETVFVCTTGTREYATGTYNGQTWYGSDDEIWEAEIDLPGSGSMWFVPDNERGYFVKWFNKEPYLRSKPRTQFQPMRDENGSPVFNTSIMSEHQLFKAPNFIDILRAKVHKRTQVEKVLDKHLQLDDDSTKGIAGIVCTY